MWRNWDNKAIINAKEIESAVTLVITTCTNRKRQSVTGELRICTLPSAHLADLAAEWGDRLSSAEVRFPAHEIYGGRGFQEARSVARELNAQLLVVSAGLGLIDASSEVPPYACTILTNAPDSVASRVDGAFSSSRWWASLVSASPFSVDFWELVNRQDGMILCALSDAYLEMIADDLLALPEVTRARLRLFTRAPIERIANALRQFVMPYDDRLNGPDSPISGTLSDFAGRALRHFASEILVGDHRRSLTEHTALVTAALAGWRLPEKAVRIRLEDREILELMRAHWRDCGGIPLRRLRNEFNVACEQGRYARLASAIRSEQV